MTAVQSHTAALPGFPGYAKSVSSSANTWDSGCGPTYCWQLHWPDS